MNLRLKKLSLKLQKEGLQGLIVSSPANVSYLTEGISRDAYLLVSQQENLYFTDSRYLEEASRFLKGKITLRQPKAPVFSELAKTCLGLGIRRVGFESRHMPFAEYHKIKEYSGGKLELVPTHSLVEGLRQLKQAGEIKKMRKALKIAAEAMAFLPRILAKGRREIEIAGELERFIRFKGGYSSAFDIIVASGANSSQPHHLCTGSRLKDDSPVLVDLGVDYQGYKSDLTRVFFLGKIKGLVRRVYEIVLKAQERAIKEIKPGAEIGRIDACAREYIRRNGYGRCFGHNLGHGCGLEVHESPSIGPANKDALKPGMIFTVEPGIYLPGRFGVRIEDMVLVTRKGCEVLSGAVNK